MQITERKFKQYSYESLVLWDHDVIENFSIKLKSGTLVELTMQITKINNPITKIWDRDVIKNPPIELKLGTLIKFGMEITQIKFKLVNLKIWYCMGP